MDEYPDAKPETGSGNIGSVPADISLTTAAQQFLYQTGPWVRFMSVMIFISAGFMALLGAGLILLSTGSRIPLGPRPFPMLPAGNSVFGSVYILIAILHAMAGFFLFRYANSIRILRMGRSAQTLEDALSNQKSFWRYVGIVTIIHVAMVVILIVLVLFLFIRTGIMRVAMEHAARPGAVFETGPGIMPPRIGGGSGLGTGFGDTYVVGNGVTPPIALVQPLPAYTPEARKARAEGTVLIQAIVRKDGSADSFRIVKGLGYGLDESAITTIAQKWRFKPGTYRGMPVDVRANIEVAFKLY